MVLAARVERLEVKTDNLESVLEKFIKSTQSTQTSLDRLSYEMLEFKNEMSEFKNEMSEFKNEMKAETDRRNKQWGELSNKLGTFVEDIIAPAVPGMIKKRFGCETERLMVRSRARKKTGENIEYDVLAVGDDGQRVWIFEGKHQVKVEHIKDFMDAAARFHYFYPEYESRELILVISSLYIPHEIVKYATRKGVFAMGMSGEYMDILNYDDLAVPGGSG